MELTDKTLVYGIKGEPEALELQHLNHEIHRQIIQNQMIIEKLKEWYKETQEPIPEGHIPMVSLNGLAVRLEEILSMEAVKH